MEKEKKKEKKEKKKPHDMLRTDLRVKKL